MTSLFDRIRQRRGQDLPPDGPQDPAADGPAPEAPTEVHPSVNAPVGDADGVPTPPEVSDLTVVQPAVPPTAGGSSAAGADAGLPSETEGQTDPGSTGSSAPDDAAPAEAETRVAGPRSLADEAALAAELPDELPSRTPKAPRESSGLTPLIPTGSSTAPESTASAATDSDAGTGDQAATAEGTAPAVPQPPVLGPPTSGGTPPAAPPTPPTAPTAAATVPEATEVPKVTIRNRGRMRRRLRYLRRVRELGYRDLGGLVFELRRANATNQVLVDAKVDALRRIDAELHALEHGLRDYRTVEELHEPGVSVCIRCGALHGSDANYCPQCGVSVSTPVATVSAAAPPPATVDGGTPVEPEPTVAAPSGDTPGTGPDGRPRAAATPANGGPGPGSTGPDGEPTQVDTTAPAEPATSPDPVTGEPTVVLDDANPAPDEATDATADER